MRGSSARSSVDCHFSGNSRYSVDWSSRRISSSVLARGRKKLGTWNPTRSPPIDGTVSRYAICRLTVASSAVSSGHPSAMSAAVPPASKVPRPAGARLSPRPIPAPNQSAIPARTVVSSGAMACMTTRATPTHNACPGRDVSDDHARPRAVQRLLAVRIHSPALCAVVCACPLRKRPTDLPMGEPMARTTVARSGLTTERTTANIFHQFLSF